MGFYLVVLVICAALGVLSWRRSGGRMTRYLPFTGAPIIWVLLGVSALVSLVVQLASPDGEAARAVFTGGLIGTGLTQIVLLRVNPRDAVVGPGPSPGDAPPDGGPTEPDTKS